MKKNEKDKHVKARLEKVELAVNHVYCISVLNANQILVSLDLIEPDVSCELTRLSHW